MRSMFLASTAIVAAAAFSTAAQAQASDFDVAGQPLLFAGSGTGTGTTVGSSRTYTNVITIGGQRIDARVTLTGLSNATLTDFDSTANPYAETNFFQPTLNISSPGGSATFRVEFLANGQPVTLRNFYINTYDLDGSGGSAAGRQFTSFSGFASYQLSSTTSVQLQPAGSATQFVTTVGGNITASPGTAQFNDVRARVFYTSASSVDLSVGDNGATGTAYFGLDFSLGYAFANAAADTTAPNVGTGQTLSYRENRVANTIIGKVTATDNIGVVNYRFAATNSQTSADGFYTIDNVGEVRLSAAGAAAGASTNDFELSPNSHVYAIQAADAANNWSSAQNVTFAELDEDDTAPVVTVPGNTAGAALADVSVNEGVTLATKLTADETVTWTLGGGADQGAFFVDPNSGALSFNAAPDFEAATDSDTNNIYEVIVLATDAAGNVTPTTVRVTVLDLEDTAPVVGANQTFAYAENRAANDVVGTVAATDNVAVTQFRFAANSSQTSADGYYTIDNSGVIRITAAGVAAGVANNDFEVAPNSFTYAVQAGDAANNWSAATGVVLDVTDVDDTAPVVTAGQSFSYAENQAANTAVATVLATDATGVTDFRFAATNTQTSADGYYTIDSSGVIRITAAGIAAGVANNDFEIAPNSFNYAVQARDNAGNWSAAVQVALNVTNVDDTAPAIGAGQAFSYAENRSAGAVLGQVSASDDVGVTDFRFTGGTGNVSADGYYQIDASGRLTLTAAGAAAGAATNDFETTPNSFTYGVEARDAVGNWSASVSVTLAVTDLDDSAPTIGSGQVINYLENQVAGAGLGTVSAADNVAVTAFRFAANGSQTSADGFYTIDNGGVVRLTAAGAAAGASTNDFETAPNSFTYAIEAADGAGNWSAPESVTLAVGDVSEFVNTPPVIGAGQVLTYAENRAAGDVIGTVAANDDLGVTGFRFADSGTQTSADGYYAIDNGGVVRITSAGVAAGLANNDFEVTPNSFVFRIEAGDANGAWSPATNVTFEVTNLPDMPPVITGPGGSTGGTATVSVPEGATAVTQVTSSVPGTTWAITGGTDGGSFSIDGSGNITFTAAPDFEAPADSDTNNSYVLVVEATSPDGSKTTQTITVNVTNVADTPAVITGPGGATGSTATISVQEGTTAVTQVTSNLSGTSWAIVGGTDGGRFSIDGSGNIAFTAAPDFEAPADSDTNNSYVLVVEATSPDGSKSTQTITVNVTNLADTPAVITGPGGATGSTATVSVPENRTAVTQVTSSISGTTWAITGGSDQGRFTIDGSGNIAFTAAPDFEVPTDSDTNNSYLLVVEATSPDGSKTTQTITVNVTDLPDTPPVITGPDGSTGASSTVSVPENQRTVTQMTANVPISSWAIVGGNDLGRFAIDAQGRITFVNSPDYEAPADSDTNNSYVLVIEATDANGNTSRQTITVNVTNVPDTPPVITGPGGTAGAAASTIAVNEGTTAVTTLASSQPVTWSIIGGSDAGHFSIDAAGRITFNRAPDFEAPTDSDRNNSYVLVVEARAADGQRSTQTITVTVLDLEELRARLDQIGENLRGNVRHQVFGSLTSMLSFNEGLLGLGNSCANAAGRPVSAGVQANERQQDANMRFGRDLTSCEARTRVYVDGGVAFSRVDKNWTARGLASARIEHRIGSSSVLGASLVGSAASDELTSFANSRISDQSLQLNVYGRTHLSRSLRLAAFAGAGRAWYDFRLEDDGLVVDGRATGDRHLYGAALSGDIRLGGVVLTTDAILSRASEKLGSAKLDASFGGETGSDLLFELGRVDVTRFSVPVHVPIVLDRPTDGREPSRLDISPGVLCQDIAQDSSALDCGYQFGLKFRTAPTLRSVIRAEARTEAVDGTLLNSFTLGFQRVFGAERRVSLGIDASRQARAQHDDNRVMFSLAVRP